MHCPKCNHRQNNAQECEACGLIFEKYRKVQERKREAAETTQEVEKSGAGLKILQILVLVVVVAATTYYFTGYRKQDTVSQQPAETPTVALQQEQERQPTSKPAIQAAPSSQPAAMKHNVIERARNSTVSIETPWGTGSGFFVNKNYIVTNRHVVQFDERKLAEFKQKVENSRRMIDLEQQKLKDLRKRLRQMPKGPARSQLALFISSREAELQKIMPRQKEGEERLDKLESRVQPSDIKIILADGSEHVANYLLVSDSYDLALMSLFSSESTYLERSPATKRLHQGDKVYAIGSPVGLRFSVTAGIFSSYRKQEDNGQVYLQTDAAINPGNSGGPLIDENGYARGVTTMILRDTEGIGFAIPIEKVFEEFSSTLY